MLLSMCSAVEFEEADERLAAGWHVDPCDLNPQDSAQRKRYLRAVKDYSDAQNHRCHREGPARVL